MQNGRSKLGTPISVVLTDVDGTLLTHDKILTDRARGAVQRLHDKGIMFTITSGRPPFGMRHLVAPLGLTLPMANERPRLPPLAAPFLAFLTEIFVTK